MTVTGKDPLCLRLERPVRVPQLGLLESSPELRLIDMYQSKPTCPLYMHTSHSGSKGLETVLEGGNRPKGMTPVRNAYHE